MESKLYNPAGQPKDWLIANFVARTNVFERIFKDIKTGTMQYPEQHYLIQGQRGMGKTTLLLRLKYEIENTPQLNKWLVPVFFNEESYDLTSLSNLWEKLLKYLDSLWETGGEYYEKTNEFVGKNDYEKRCFDLLLEILKVEKKKLVIFFDNFGQLFLDNLSEKEQHRFREILMGCNDIRLIGASAVVLQDLHDYSKPFFEFFKIINLDGLNKDETFQLIKKLQEGSTKKINIEKYKGKIETLAILTGGVIRTIMLIYEVILADEDGSALRDLETILDRITPLYKHRIEDLPVQQRKIIDVIAKRWDAISTKEIAENIREDGKPMATKLISAQLQQLEKNNVIEKKKTNTKNHLYQLTERFFNIWYLMRNGDRMDKCRVMWLTKFLETWYDDNTSIESFIKKHIKLLKTGKYYPDSAIMIAEALTNSSKIDFENQANLIKATEAILNDNQKRLLPKISLEKYESAVTLYEKKNFNEAIKLLESTSQTSLHANVLLFTCYIHLRQTKKAIESINEGSKVKPYLLGLAYSQLKDYNKAIRYFEEAINLRDEKLLPARQIHSALGFFYAKGKMDISRAIKHYEIALKLGEDSAYKHIIDIYTKNRDYHTVEKYYLDAIREGKAEYEAELIGFYIFKSREFEKANSLIIEGRSKHPNDPIYLFYHAIMCFLEGDDKNAEKYFLLAKKFFKDSDDHYRMINIFLLLMYIEGKNKDKALLITRGFTLENNSVEYLINAIINIWNNKFKDGFNLINKYIISDKDTAPEMDFSYDETLLLLLIAKKQYHFALQLFEKKELNYKDKFKPIYYTLMQYLKDEYPNEHLKMGEELQQPVKDIMERIEEMAVEYA